MRTIFFGNILISRTFGMPTILLNLKIEYHQTFGFSEHRNEWWDLYSWRATRCDGWKMFASNKLRRKRKSVVFNLFCSCEMFKCLFDSISNASLTRCVWFTYFAYYFFLLVSCDLLIFLLVFCCRSKHEPKYTFSNVTNRLPGHNSKDRNSWNHIAYKKNWLCLG